MFNIPFLNFTLSNNKTSGIDNLFKIFNSTGYDEPIFNIFGISLYLDDILILCILFTLYINDVHDNMLFLSLVLLIIT